MNAPAMKRDNVRERPILFSGEMVRAILDGRKTQTRRIVKPQPEQGMSGYWHPCSKTGVPAKSALHYANEKHLRKGLAADFCPYGQVGDHLWVREKWRVELRGGTPLLDFAADPGAPDLRPVADSARKYGTEGNRWRPSIHMPRWASRITLEITGVRVERLQDIKAGDAAAEGIQNTPNVPANTMAWALWHIESFRELWESINGKRAPWKSNPWVWVLEFKRVQP